MHFVLTYEVGADFIARRAQFRDEHLALAWKAAGAGELLLAGALEEGAGQAMLLFRGTREAAMRFAQADPYVKNGLVARWSVRQWHTVAGDAAAMPMRPRQAAG
ncbi:MAG TPA: YciI-like protein [Verrucomicrobiae bacterium]|nr:YciI-like protein [Verrucomicrobiae bacterium]